MGPPDPLEPWQVAVLRGQGGGRNAFRHRLPAVKASSFGVGGRSHLVQQVFDSSVVLRRVAVSEVERLFCSERVPMLWGYSDTEKVMRMGNSAPPSMVLPVFDGFVRFCRPRCAWVPRSISDIVSEETASAFRGHMAQQFADFTELKKRNLLDVAPGQLPPKNTTRTRGHRPAQCDAGLVLPSQAPIPFYLGDYWVTLQVDDIIPADYLQGPSSIHKSLFEALAVGFPDRELVTALTGTGIFAKDIFRPAASMFATNHKKASSHHRFVDNMYTEEVQGGRMLQFSVRQSPPFFPCAVYPTGATTKKKR